MKRKRKIGALFIVTALILMLLPISEAQAASSASDFTIQNKKLVKYKGTDKEVTVPDTVEVIGEGAFEENATVEKITLPKSVTKIEPYAFWGCDKLHTVILGSGMTEIGDFAFSNCKGLRTISIPSGYKSIGIQAFAYCERLEDISIPASVYAISEDAFEGDYLLNIRCEAGSYADRYAQDFYERQKEMPVYGEVGGSDASDAAGNDAAGGAADGSGGSSNGSSVTPGLLYEIQTTDGSLLGSTYVVGNRAVVIMQSSGLDVKSGGNVPEAPAEDTEAADAQTEPEGTDDAVQPYLVAERKHYRDGELGEVFVAGGVREIGRFAYARSGLTKITLPDGLEQIDYAAFYYCRNLTHVELPRTVMSVASRAFSHTPWLENFLDGRDDTKGDFLISGGVLVAYRGGAEEVTIPDDVRVIAGDAFENHPEIKKVIFPAALQVIDEDAFVGCSLEAVERQGDADVGMLLEQQISLNSMAGRSAEPVRRFQWVWIVSAGMLLTGGACILRRNKV